MLCNGMEKRATKNLGLEGVVYVKMSYTSKIWLDVRNWRDFFLSKIIFGLFSSGIEKVYMGRQGSTWT